MAGTSLCHQAGNRQQHSTTEMLSPSIQVFSCQLGEASHPFPALLITGTVLVDLEWLNKAPLGRVNHIFCTLIFFFSQFFTASFCLFLCLSTLTLAFSHIKSFSPLNTPTISTSFAISHQSLVFLLELQRNSWQHGYADAVDLAWLCCPKAPKDPQRPEKLSCFSHRLPLTFMGLSVSFVTSHTVICHILTIPTCSRAVFQILFS